MPSNIGTNVSAVIATARHRRRASATVLEILGIFWNGGLPISEFSVATGMT